MTGLFLLRFADLLLTLLIVSLAIFAVMNWLPGDPASIMLGTSATPETLASLRHQLGFDEPMAPRYLHWLLAAASGDLGQSYTYGVPVAGLIMERLAVTLPLALMAIGLSVAAGIPLGVMAASKRGGFADRFAAAFSQMSIAIPAFWAGLLLILLFAMTLGWAPAGGFPGWREAPLDAVHALLLPAIALALPQAGVLTRVTRAAMLDILQDDFIRTAHAKGLSRSAILWRHGFPNALVPVLAIIGLQFTFLIGGAVLVENVFNLPGLGRLAFQALSQRDIVVMQDVVLLFSALVIVVNFLVDLAFLMIDPRLRHRGSQ